MKIFFTTDINECATDSPCFNGGTCHDDVGRYTCECAAGYEGTFCECGKEKRRSSKQAE